MRERVLTEEEKSFAERNIQILNKYRNSEYSGTAAIAYLSAVQTWFREPGLQKKYTFPAVAITEIRKEIYKERMKEKDNVQATINLNSTIREDSSITYLECVTSQNLRFTSYISAEEDGEKIAHGRHGEMSGRQTCEENLLIRDFLYRQDKNMRFRYDTKEEARRKGHTVRKFISRNHLTSIQSMVRENCIYIIRHTGGCPNGSFV